jgi:two-component sensor histidine kinase
MYKTLIEHGQRYGARLIRPLSVDRPWEILSHRSMRPAWIILALGLVISFFVWRLVAMAVTNEAQDRFRILTSRIIAKTHLTMTAYEQVLRGAVGLLKVRENTSRKEFGRFVEAMDLDRAYPGLQGLGYAVVIKPADLKKHVEAIRRKGRSDYSVRPSGERPYYSSILFLEPSDRRNKGAIGYDMFSEPVRSEAMLRARDEARPSLSGRVILVQEAKKHARPGFVLFMPVYKSGLPSGTLEQRRRNIAGVVFAPFRADTLMYTILSRELSWVPNNVAFAIYDGSKVSDGKLLFQTPNFAGSDNGSEFTLVEESDFFGRTWTFRFASSPAFDRSVSQIASHLALVSSLLLTMLLFVFITMKTLRQLQLSHLNAQMMLLTRELSHRVKNTLAVVQSIASRSLSNRSSVEEAREVFMKRLHALARAHTLLFENLWRGASLHALARQELEPFGARATIQGPDVQLNASSAQTLALTLHELATNALKHGAMSVEAGKLAVRWSVSIVDGEPTFRFRWQENGGPPVKAPTRRGFGHTLLNQRLGLGGNRPEVLFAPTGLVYQVLAPLKSISAIDQDDDDEQMLRLLEEASDSEGNESSAQAASSASGRTRVSA